MARHTWHKAPNRYQEADYRALTAGARCLLRDLDEVLHREGTVTANVSTLAGWFGLDRKTTREGIEAIARTSLLSVTKEERGKAGTFYTVTTPGRTSNQPQADPESTPDEPQTNPEAAPHTSANNAGSSDSSLGEEIRKEEKRGEDEDAERGRVKRILQTLEKHLFIVDGHQKQTILSELDDPPPRLRGDPESWTDWICLAVKETADSGVRNVRYLSRVIQTSRETQLPPGTRLSEKGGTNRDATAKTGTNRQPYRPPNGYERDLSGLTAESW